MSLAGPMQWKISCSIIVTVYHVSNIDILISTIVHVGL